MTGFREFMIAGMRDGQKASAILHNYFDQNRADYIKFRMGLRTKDVGDLITFLSDDGVVQWLIANDGEQLKSFFSYLHLCSQ